jgi:hypothetical protein
MECAQIFLMSYLDDVFFEKSIFYLPTPGSPEKNRYPNSKLPLGPWYDYSWLTNPLTTVIPHTP